MAIDKDFANIFLVGDSVYVTGSGALTSTIPVYAGVNYPSGCFGFGEETLESFTDAPRNRRIFTTLTTADATPTRAAQLFVGGGVADYRMVVVGVNPTDFAKFKREQVFIGEGTPMNYTSVGGITSSRIDTGTDSPTWNMNVTASGEFLQVFVTGSAGGGVRWLIDWDMSRVFQYDL